MAKSAALAALLLFAAVPAGASLLESSSGGLVTYQFDAETFHDAPDTCEGVLAATEAFEVPMDGTADGILVPADDEVDHFTLAILPADVGDRVLVYVGAPAANIELSLDVQVPGCGVSVTAPEAQPMERPLHPDPATGEKQVAPSSLKDGSPDACGGLTWRFVANQFGDLIPPPSIHGIWSDGTEADIPLVKSTSATTVFYDSSYNTGIRLQSVAANVPEAWEGQFNSVHGPCGAVDGGAVYGDPSTASQTSISFTPITAGTHVVSVRLLPPEVPGVPTSVPASCHFCVDGTDGLAESVSYITSANKQAA